MHIPTFRSRPILHTGKSACVAVTNQRAWKIGPSGIHVALQTGARVTPAELRRLAEQLPAGAALSLDRATLLEVTAGIVVDTTHTVATLAAQLHRSASTVRGWLEEGRFPGAYHLPASGKVSKRGRPKVGAWRIPQVALDAFTGRPARQEAAGTTIGTRADTRPRPRRARNGDRADLGAWRAERPAASR